MLGNPDHAAIEDFRLFGNFGAVLYERQGRKLAKELPALGTFVNHVVAPDLMNVGGGYPKESESCAREFNALQREIGMSLYGDPK